MLKRFRFGGQDSITNPNPNIIRLTKNHESESEYSGFGGKDSNPNPNIRYNTGNDHLSAASLRSPVIVLLHMGLHQLRREGGGFGNFELNYKLLAAAACTGYWTYVTQTYVRQTQAFLLPDQFPIAIHRQNF